MTAHPKNSWGKIASNCWQWALLSCQSIQSMPGLSRYDPCYRFGVSSDQPRSPRQIVKWITSTTETWLWLSLAWMPLLFFRLLMDAQWHHTLHWKDLSFLFFFFIFSCWFSDIKRGPGRHRRCFVKLVWFVYYLSRWTVRAENFLMWLYNLHKSDAFSPNVP